MSTNYLTALIERVGVLDPDLASDLQAHIETTSARREFGLVFNKHIPEAIELPGRIARRGDKVRISAKGEDRMWLVARTRRVNGQKVADLVALGATAETLSAPLADLVVVADFRDSLYPGLHSTGKIERGGDKPFHIIIKGENYHALETLLFSHRGRIDCIYIDPPYNTRAKDWKYNNDYVDPDDRYSHSKWLSMMERRLKLAKPLLNPERSVLIVTIDEKEVHHLGLLLEQTFPGAVIQMVSSLINPAAVARARMFGRADEYLFFVMLGSAAPQRVRISRDWVSAKGRTHTGTVRWDLLRRSSTNAERAHSPGCFYAIYIDPTGPRVAEVGEPLPPGVSTPRAIPGLTPVLPIRKDRSEGNWQWSPGTFRSRLEQGRVRVTGSKSRGFTISVLKEGEYHKIERGEYQVVGKAADGSLLVAKGDTSQVWAVPNSQSRIPSHDATQYGSRLLAELLPGRRFPFPKSLYAVEDALRFFIGNKPDALVLDFFAGSGTTAHAVARLNHQDGGRRQAVLVTNNEVSAEEAQALHRRGHCPGDPEWEALGIYEHVTRPRIVAAITGRTPSGQPVRGDYKFTDGFPMADGLAENVEFFDLTYEDPERVRLDYAFQAVAPMLWLRAGGRGSRFDRRSGAFEIADRYGILFDPDYWMSFVEALSKATDLACVFVVTDNDSTYHAVAAQLSPNVEKVRLYESYLKTFEINAIGGE